MLTRFSSLLPLLALVALAFYPLAVVGTPNFADSTNYFYRLVALDWHLQHGDFYPRWFSDLHYGFGAPVLNYYAPLPFYIALIPRLGEATIAQGYAIAYLLIFITAACGLYVWARALRLSPLASFVAASGYLFTPQLYINTLHRGNYPEMWGVALTPWLFWATLQLGRNPNRLRQLLFIIFFSVLPLTHNLIAFIVTPLMTFYYLITVLPSCTNFKSFLTRLWPLIQVITLSILISAFYLLPVLFEVQFVSLSRTIVEKFYYNFSNLEELFWLPIPFDIYRLGNPHGPPNGPAFSLPQVLLVVGGGAFSLGHLLSQSWGNHPKRWLNLKEHSLLLMVHGALFIALLILSLPISTPLWEIIPLARFIQTPKRLLGLAALLLAVLAGTSADKIRQHFLWLNRSLYHEVLFAGTSIATIFFFSLPWSYHLPYQPLPAAPRIADVIRYEVTTGLIGTTTTREFLPRTVEELPNPNLMLSRYAADSLPSHLAPPPDGITYTASATLTTDVVTYTAAAPSTLTFYRFAFPGWVATLDGQEARIDTLQPNGNIAVQVPAGTHTLRLALTPTLPQISGTLISILAIVASLIHLMTLKTSSPPPSSTQSFSPHANLLLSLIIIALLLLRVFYLDRVETPFRRTQLNNLPNPTLLNFGDQLDLIGYTAPPASISSGGTLNFTLYWRLHQLVNDDYSITVQLADRFGNRFGASDSQHPDLVPTSHWQMEQYAQDEHNLKSFIGTPPGEYRLLVSVYNTIKRLNVMRDGAPAEVEYELGKVIIERGATQPASELKLVEYSVAQRELGVGEALAFTIMWHTGQIDTQGLTAAVSFTDANNQTVFRQELPPSGPDYTPDKWQRNELVRYPHAIIVPPDLKAGTYRIGLTLSTGARFELGAINVTAPTRSFNIPPMPKRVDYDFNNAIRLLGYDVSGDSITLFWQAKQVLAKRLTVFVHKLEKGVVTAGHDAPPPRPTTSWLPGEVITDVHPLGVGNTFEIGLYDPITGERFGEVFITKP